MAMDLLSLIIAVAICLPLPYFSDWYHRRKLKNQRTWRVVEETSIVKRTGGKG